MPHAMVLTCGSLANSAFSRVAAASGWGPSPHLGGVLNSAAMAALRALLKTWTRVRGAQKTMERGGEVTRWHRLADFDSDARQRAPIKMAFSQRLGQLTCTTREREGLTARL
jgi:hypothetical protein